MLLWLPERQSVRSIDIEIQDSLIDDTLKEIGEKHMAKLVSRTYGDALFELAVEENQVDRAVMKKFRC